MIGANRSLAAIMCCGLAAAISLSGQTQRDPPRTTPAQPLARDPSTAVSTGTAVIAGTVMSADVNPRPVRRASVNLTGGDAPRVTLTDDNGRFMFPELPPGRFTLLVTKSGWVPGYYGAMRPGRGPGTTIALTAGQRAGADVKLTRGAVIAGRVIDQNGQPVMNARLQVLEFRDVGGEPFATPVRGMVGSGGGSSTDDRGEYRLYGLPAGSFVVAATPPVAGMNSAARVTTVEEVQWALRQGSVVVPGTSTAAPPPGPVIGFAPVFYPGTADMTAATSISVAAGEERTSIDITMQPVALARVAGTVSRADGAEVQGAQIVLNSATMTVMGLLDPLMSRSTVDARGRFLFPSVRPGQYRVLVRASSQPPPPAGPPGSVPVRPPGPSTVLDLYGTADVVVNGQDIENLAIVLQPGSTLSGRIVFEATTVPAPTDFTRVRLQLMPPLSNYMSFMRLSADFHTGPASADGTFTLPGITPGKYMLSAFASVTVGNAASTAQWTIKSVVAAGRDLTDVPIEIRSGEHLSDFVITFTDRSGEIAGTIFDGAGRAAPGYTIFVFPSDESAWMPTARRFRPPSQPSSDGKYRVTGLPPGTYYIAALTEIDEFDLLDSAFLKQLAAASIKITLKDGEKKVQDIKIR